MVTHSASKSAEGFFNVGLNVKFLDYFLPVLSKLFNVGFRKCVYGLCILMGYVTETKTNTFII